MSQREASKFQYPKNDVPHNRHQDCRAPDQWDLAQTMVDSVDWYYVMVGNWQDKKVQH